MTGDPEQPGGWGWSITSFHPCGHDYGYMGSGRGLAAFANALGADIPEGADEDIGPIRAPGSAEAEYVVAYNRVALRLLAMLAHASRVALDSYPPTTKVIAEQERRFAERLERERPAVLAKLQARMEAAASDADHDLPW